MRIPVLARRWSAERIPARRPGRDPRLVVGLVLVVAAALLGVRTLSAAGARTPVWAAARDLAPGSVIGPGDLVPVEVHLAAASARYVPVAAGAEVGRRLSAGLRAGELLPTAAFSGPADRRQVTVPVEPGHLPAALAHGALVDVYVTARDPAGAVPTAARLVLAGVLVAEVPPGDSTSGQVPVVLDVGPEQAAALVAAVRGGSVDLVGRK